MKTLLYLALILGSTSIFAQGTINPPLVIDPPGQSNGVALDSPSHPGIYGQTLLIAKHHSNSASWRTSAIPACLTICSTNGRVIKVVTSDRVGHYHCFLRPGDYVVRTRLLNRRPGIDAPRPFPITVRNNLLTGMDIAFCKAPTWPPVAFEGSSLEIVLPANHTTGYQWQLANSSDLLQWMGTEYLEFARAGMVGAPGFEHWTFKALALGQTELQFNYVQPWTADPPAFTTNIPVSVFGAIAIPCSAK